MKKYTPIAASGLVIVVLVAGLVWLYRERTRLEHALAVSTGTIADLKHQNSDLSDALTNSESTVANFQKQIGDISSTVGTLVKLKNTDPELLQKYSKVYFLSDNYVPKGLVDIASQYTFDKSRQYEFLGQAEPKLYSLMDDAKASGLDLLVDSAYRSFAEQNNLKSAYKVTYGAGTANSFSADQGYSEHQLGTAVDFTTTKIGGALTGFEKTPEYQWLTDNAYKYGFVLSFPPGNDYYIFEPWHWRFVGTALALRLREEKQNFVDLQQRQIDPYLVDIFN